MYILVIFVVFLTVTRATGQTIKTSYVCPTGFLSIKRNCYYFGNEQVTWTNARFQCEASNSTLLVFDSLKEENLLKGFIIQDNNRTISPSEKWIDGIYDWKQNMWKWGLTGKFIKQNAFTKVKKGDNFKWSCIALNSAKNNKWVARRCTEKKSYICKTQTNIFVEFKLYNKRKKNFNITKCNSRLPLDNFEKRRCNRLLGRSNDEPSEMIRKNSTKPHSRKHRFDGWICPSHMISLANRCYLFSTKETTWTDAHFECKRNRSKLAIIRNRNQDRNLRMFANNFIEENFPSSFSSLRNDNKRHERWIGGIYNWKSSKWIWAVSGQSISYNGFSIQAMQNRTTDSLKWNGIFLDPAYDNQWNAAKLTEKKKFICQVQAKGVKNIGRRKKKLADATITILKNKK
ncbi:uncharacterized protein LOC130446826 isoform X1 [Diorhabda sublineata]|uniref:uncharacterized protein LOC130446826 isoform X1 n=1 Tax=Diorhabda sublineata TaxID=1163346 RepID=UPI0024E1807D|nr:uncharacterized protein LOC130446826 isoform X1 [Diorhabda sublineata]